MTDLTPLQRANLLTLANYLMKLPDDYEHFGMAHFFEGDHAVTDVAHCGTTACAVGHGPAAGITPLPHHWDTYGQSSRLDWWDYSKDLLCSMGSGAWDFMFSGCWDEHDDTPRGAAARIRYVLKGGLIPDSLSDDYFDTRRYETYLVK